MKYFPDPKTQVPPVELLPLPIPRGGSRDGHRTDEVLEPLEQPHVDITSKQDRQPLAESSGQRLRQFRSQGRRLEEGAGKIDIRQPIINEFLESGNLEANSRRAYGRSLKRFLETVQVPFAEVTPRQFTQYRDWLENTPTTRTGKPLARASVNLEVAALKVFFGWLHQHYPHHCPADPTIQVKQRKVSVPSPDDISPEALNWIWIALPNLGEMAVRDTALVHLLMHGLRASEIVELNLASLDGEAVFLSETKTHCSRVVPLSQASIQVMQQYLRWLQNDLGLSLHPEQPLIVSLHAGYRGKRLSYVGIYQAVERIGARARELCVLDWLNQMEEQEKGQLPSLWWSAAQAVRQGAELGRWDEDSLGALLHLMPLDIRRILDELGNLHPHNFRHTYATQLLFKGLDPAHARKLTGHQSQQVFKRYTQRAEQQAAIDAFRRLEESGGSIVPHQGGMYVKEEGDD